MNKFRILKGKESVVLSAYSLKLNIFKNMYVVPKYRNDNKWISPFVQGKNSGDSKPIHYAVIGGKEVDKFKLLPKSISAKEIYDFLGKGVRFYLTARDSSSLDVPVRMELLIDIYEEFPSSIIIRSFFHLEGEGSYTFDRLHANNLLLDATRVGKTKIPYDFFGYFGSGEIREHSLQRITEDFQKDCYQGIYASYDGGGAIPDYRWGTLQGYGGGLPINDLWQKNLGVAVCHIEPKYKLCSLPIEVLDKKFVSMSLNYKTREKIAKDVSFASIKTAIILHEGDFFNGLSAYSNMLKRQGMNFPEGIDESYEPSWCSWGYFEDCSKEDVFAMIPSLKKIGIKWITLDDRWFDCCGNWMPRKDLYPGGEEDMKQFIQKLHDEGFKVQIWTIPGEADSVEDPEKFIKEHPSAEWEIRKHPFHTVAKISKEHPDWFIAGPDGKKEVSKRSHYFLCPSVNGVLKYFHDLTKKMFGEWKVDGLKQDAVHQFPCCYAKNHNHLYPEESAEKFSEILRVIYETATQINPEAVIQSCPCGTPPLLQMLEWQNQGVTADPWTSWVCRGYTKMLKAIMGPRAAVYADHVEIIDGGDDFASQMGAGAVLGTRYTYTGEDKTAIRHKHGALSKARSPLTKEKIAYWKKWMDLYKEKMISKGEYLNLYDFVYDKPEIHAIRKDGKMYYSVYLDEPNANATYHQGREFNGKQEGKEIEFSKNTPKMVSAVREKEFKGKIELRGLKKGKRYRVYDYVNRRKLNDISGNKPFLEVAFKHCLLIEVTEK